MSHDHEKDDGVETGPYQRRLARLREELIDEEVPLPLLDMPPDDLLAELHYARRPPQHENRTSDFGALIFREAPRWDRSPLRPLIIPCTDLPAEVVRRFADGRSSFVVREPGRPMSLAGFEHSLADEVWAVALQRTGAIVVQRIYDRGLRVCATGGVVHWTGIALALQTPCAGVRPSGL